MSNHGEKNKLASLHHKNLHDNEKQTFADVSVSSFKQW